MLQIQSWSYYQANDTSLAAHLAAAPGVKCAACTDGPEAHLTTWLHGSSLLDASFTQLPTAKALPGADHGQIWFWTRRHQVCCVLHMSAGSGCPPFLHRCQQHMP